MPKQSNVKVFEHKTENTVMFSISLFIGPRGSGKTEGLFDAAKTLGPLHEYCIVLSSAQPTIDEFSKFVKSCYIYDDPDPQIIGNLLESQRELQQSKLRVRDVLLVLDDTLTVEGFGTSTEIRKLFADGRHLHITVLIVAQYITMLEKRLRGQVGTAYVYDEPDQATLQTYHKSWFNQCCPNKTYFLQVAQSIFKRKYYALVYNKVDTSKLFYFKADMTKPYVLVGSRASWKAAYMYERAEGDDNGAHEAAAAKLATLPGMKRRRHGGGDDGADSDGGGGGGGESSADDGEDDGRPADIKDTFVVSVTGGR